MTFISAVLGGLVLVLLPSLLALIKSYISSQPPRGARKLPGPKGLPLLGKLLQIPPTHSWLQFKTWANQYGPLYGISIAGRPQAIVSSEKIANDLLRERGSIYSSREQLVMGAHLLSNDLRPVLLPYGEVWRRGRKVAQSFTASTVAPNYEPIQELESLYCLRDFLREPKEYERWFDRYAGGIILRLAYGKRITTGKEEFVQRIVKVNHNLERIASPGSYLVDTFPSLNLLPSFLAPWKREGARLHAEELDLFTSLLNSANPANSPKSNPPPPSFARTWWETRAKSNLTLPQAAYVIGTLFEAGAGTTKAALCSFLLALLHHPHWLHRMQSEIDSIVPPTRLPLFTDLPQLPTVRACIKETLRWRPVTSGGLPHQLTRPDTYNGLYLPAGTNVHPNQWAIHRDPSLYPDPESYNPSRWLEPDWPTYREPLTTYPNLQNYSCFGFGRRICVGQNIAERNLMIMAARIGWACEMRVKEGGVGVPWYEYRSGFNSYPEWFGEGMEVKVRSKERGEVVEREYAKAKEVDRDGEGGI
ncbi:MAG: hypothetical protein Q9227_000322 [Pyrenula ochraceoflavens]